MDVLGGDAGVLHRLTTRTERALDQVRDELLELRPGQGQDEVLRPARVRGDEGQVDLGLEGRRQLALGLLGGLLEPLQRHAILLEVDAVLALELVRDPVDNPLVEIVTAEVGVTVRGLDLEHAVADLENRDVERAAAEVVHDDRLLLLLVHAVGQRGRGRLVDDPEDLEPGDPPGILGGLSLAVVEVGRHGDDGLGDLLAQVGLGRLLELAQDHGGDFGGRIRLAPHLDADVAVLGADDLVRDELDLLQHLVVTAPHESLDREDRVFRVRDRLALRHLPDQDFAVLREAHDGRGQAAALLVRDHRGVPALDDRHHRVRRPEVDTDYLRHVDVLPFRRLISQETPAGLRAGHAGPRGRPAVRPASPQTTSILISLGLISSTFGSLISSTPSR